MSFSESRGDVSGKKETKDSLPSKRVKYPTCNFLTSTRHVSGQSCFCLLLHNSYVRNLSFLSEISIVSYYKDTMCLHFATNLVDDRQHLLNILLFQYGLNNRLVSKQQTSGNIGMKHSEKVQICGISSAKAFMPSNLSKEKESK